MIPLLALDGLTREFGGLMAVYDVSFDVLNGQIKALIGPNGAGKSTILNMINGVLKPTRGQIRLDGRPVEGMQPYLLARLGVARTFQNLELFRNMTVLENVMVSRHMKSRAGFGSAIFSMPWTVREEKAIVASARHWLSVVGLAGCEALMAGDLPFGGQRLLEIARALATEPRLLLLDEVASGLTAAEKRGFADLIYTIRDAGVSVLLVDHDMELVMDISDEVVVVDYGIMIAQGRPESVREDPRVISAYLGEELGDAQA